MEGKRDGRKWETYEKTTSWGKLSPALRDMMAIECGCSSWERVGGKSRVVKVEDKKKTVPEWRF